MGIGFIVRPGFTLYRDITVESGGNGSVSGGGRILSGDMVTLTASPAADYKFNGWYDREGNLVSTANPYRFTVREDIHLKATFSLVLRNIVQNFYLYRNDGNMGTYTISYWKGMRPKAIRVHLGVSTGHPFWGYTDQEFTSSGTKAMVLHALKEASGYITRLVTVNFYSTYATMDISEPTDYSHEGSITLIHV